MSRLDDDDRVPRLDEAQAGGVQSLLLRRPLGDAVRHLLLRVPPGRGLAARKVLKDAFAVSFGIPSPTSTVTRSLGFTFAGLEALHLPAAYLRVFQRLARSFRTGAVRRSTAVGDVGASSAAHWEPSFAQDRVHVVVSWHGPADTIDPEVEALLAAWSLLLWTLPKDDRPQFVPTRFDGQRLGAPGHQSGQWAHFGFRDDVSDVSIDRVRRNPEVLDLRQHAPGALLLGWLDDEGLNRFALPQAPEKVRGFFRSASFGVLRRMVQDVEAFEDRVAAWQGQFDAAFGPGRVDRDFARAKLCGRWPDGRALRPGALVPPRTDAAPDYRLDLHTDDEETGGSKARDPLGTGCPFGSHVRRMQAEPDARGNVLSRPLLRRSVPFGPALVPGPPPDETPLRGHLGHFFCADIENQFEHLLGQWAARPLLHADTDDDALDPFAGPHDDPNAGLRVPLENRSAQRLTGFRPWTTTAGMAYAWYPGREGLRMLFENDVIPEELAGPWL